MELLQAKSITKKFINKKALDNLSLSMEKGKIYGLLGPNGSGKTTFMKIIAGLVYPTSGSIQIDKENIGVNTKKIVSYMPTSSHIPKWMKIKNCIKYYEDMYSDFDKSKAMEMMDFMGLNIEQKISDLSTGMLGRLKLSLTFSRNAKLYVLDEPLNGIDPISREKIMDTILKTCNEENTIIISSHLVKELETIIDEAVFIDKGTVILSGNAEDLRIERNMSIDDIYREVYKDV